MNALESLKKVSIVVADTGDFHLMEQYNPQDATTNPTLILRAAVQPTYSSLVDSVVDGSSEMDDMIDRLLVLFGCHILRVVPGRVSTEVDARLSFDTEKTVEKAKKLIGMYAENGVDKERVLIKIAATWEGIEAAKILEAEGIHCNLTLVFALEQAVMCAKANARVLSPFVGRVMDWFKHKTGYAYEEQPETDPGVILVKDIYNYYKKFGCETEILAASLRSVGEVLQLAGCDMLTIPPKLLEVLKVMELSEELKRILSVEESKECDIEEISMNEKEFRFRMNEDAMATEKLAEGIRTFSADIIKLEIELEKRRK